MNIKKPNIIISDNGSLVEVDVSTKKHPLAIMLIDKDKWEYLREMNIGRVSATGVGKKIYCTGWSDGKNHKIHTLLINGAECVDHANHNGLDNRISNLRACTLSQNSMNKVKLPNNTSGTTGVNYSKKDQCWMTRIMVKGKSLYLGSFDNIEHAIGVRKQAEVEYFGEFAYGAH